MVGSFAGCCARSERPRRRCAAEQGDELAPSHELPLEGTSLADEGVVHRSESRFRVKTRSRLFPVYVGSGQLRT